jgi:hypothetical protein
VSETMLADAGDEPSATPAEDGYPGGSQATSPPPYEGLEIA